MTDSSMNSVPDSILDDHTVDAGLRAELARGDELLAEGAREVSDYVTKRLLRMDYQTFYASIFTRQGELDKFVSMSSEPRRQAVERLLGISDVRDAGQRARQQKRDLGNRLEGLRSQLIARDGEPLQPRLKAELAALQAQIDQLQAQQRDTSRTDNSSR